MVLGIENYFNFPRNAQLITLQDRDVLAIWTDILSSGATGDLLLKDSAGNDIYTSSGSDLNGKSVLLYSRISNGKVTNGVRAVPFVDEAVAKPIIGAMNPTITYNAEANLLNMFFWCTMSGSVTDVYDENSVYEKFDGNDWKISASAAEESGTTRYLFSAVGSINRFYVSGWEVPTTPEALEGFDLVPIFNIPKIVGISATGEDVMPFPFYPRVYEAIADESGGTINVQAVNSDGSLVGPTINFDVLPEP